MKVCLVNPRISNCSEYSLLQGLLQISAELKKNGHACHILDLNGGSRDKLSYDFLNSFDVVGLSVMTAQLKHAMEIAENLDKGVRVVWGGVHCLFDPLSIVAKHRNHFVISGDGEKPLLKLLEYFEGEKKIDYIEKERGISYFDGRPVINSPFFIKDLNELADVNFHDLPELERYIYCENPYFRKPRKIRSLIVLTSRGCNWGCTFCINDIYKKHGALHRSKSIEKIRRESEKIIDDYDIKIVGLDDEDFFINKKLVEEWKNYSREKGFLWTAKCRYNYFRDNMINEDELKDLVDSGLFAVNMSVEAGVEELRNTVIKKRVSDANIRKAVDVIRNTVGDQLAVSTGFIIDFPGDTQRNKIETLKWMNYLSSKINVTYIGPQVYRAYPGSEMYRSSSGHKEGDIDYYLSNITMSYTMRKSIGNICRSVFFSRVLQMYFSNKFKPLELEAGDAYLKWRTISKRKWRLDRFLFLASLTTLKFRLKFNYWRLFFEPCLIGFIFIVTNKLIKAIKPESDFLR